MLDNVTREDVVEHDQTPADISTMHVENPERPHRFPPPTPTAPMTPRHEGFGR